MSRITGEDTGPQLIQHHQAPNRQSSYELPSSEIGLDASARDPTARDGLAPAVEPAVHEVLGRRRRVVWIRHFLGVGAVGLGVATLLLKAKKSESAFATLVSAQPGWTVAIFLATFGTYVMATACTIGSTTIELKPVRTFTMQVASSFVNRFVPGGGVAGAVLNVRFVEQAGALRSEAIAANLLNNMAGLLVHVALFVALLPAFGGFNRDVDPPDHMALFILVLVAFVGGGALLWLRWIPNRVRHHATVMGRAAFQAIRSPRQLALLVGGSAGVTMAHAVGLWCALRAVGAHTRPVDVMIVYLAAAAAASFSPTPGGLGALEVALVTGLTRSGTAVTPAAAAVLLYRLISYWMPILPGLLAFRWLRRTEAI